jgi:hypothetical protein
MENILKMLGIDKLDESAQTELKEKLENIIDLKVTEKVKEKEDQFKSTLTDEYAEKFEQYKNDITEKFSNFLDTVLDEEMQIPENIVEYARKGELYEEVIETFKAKIGIDEGVLDEEIQSVLKESKDKLQEQKDEINKLVKELMETKDDAKELAANLYIREKCEGLDLKKQEKVISLLEGVYDKEKIDKKFDIILSTLTEEKEKDDDEDEDEDEKKKKKKKDDDDDKTDEGKNGKGKEDGFLDEGDKTPFDKMKSY